LLSGSCLLFYLLAATSILYWTFYCGLFYHSLFGLDWILTLTAAILLKRPEDDEGYFEEDRTYLPITLSIFLSSSTFSTMGGDPFRSSHLCCRAALPPAATLDY